MRIYCSTLPRYKYTASLVLGDSWSYLFPNCRAPSSKKKPLVLLYAAGEANSPKRPQPRTWTVRSQSASASHAMLPYRTQLSVNPPPSIHPSIHSSHPTKDRLEPLPVAHQLIRAGSKGSVSDQLSTAGRPQPNLEPTTRLTFWAS